ncbi:MAG: DUF1592 domain-containing protein [Phycisphaera sp.]|nr:DUF1592 domain-containing protein [Phycisphaera sp.]
MKSHGTLMLIAALLAGTTPLVASAASPATPGTSKSATPFAPAVSEFLDLNCYDCHAGKITKGKLDLKALSTDLTNDKTRAVWEAVYTRVANDEMPPKKEKVRPTAAERRTLTDWLEPRIIAAEDADGAHEMVARRLNRVEYENTVRDLLGVDTHLKDMLPEDGQRHGFDNVAGGLSISSVLMERYLDAADHALDDAIFHGFRTQVHSDQTLLKDLDKIKDQTKKGAYFEANDALVWHNTGYPQVTAHGFNAPEDGRYRFRIECWPHNPDGRSLAMAVYAGEFYRGDSFFVDYFDVKGSADEPTWLEFEVVLKARDTIRLIPYNVKSWEVSTNGGKGKSKPADYQGMGLAVRTIQREGPLGDWPPASHAKLFGDLPLEKVAEARPRGKRENAPIFGVVSKAPKEDAKRLLRDFARRAFRRPVTDADVAPFVKLVDDRLDNGYEFEAAMRVGFQAVLCSPQFLVINKATKPGDDHALASRLSYFLWSTMPDETLTKLADDGRLHERSVLDQQVERMLNDPRAAAFTENFLGQWLDLRKIAETSPDEKLYPEFDHMLEVSMVKETHAFFDELLHKDLSVLNVIDSDFAMLNERMAELYGIDGVRGFDRFRRVPLPKGCPRGGVVTQASVLKVTANGTNTSPVLRGVWMLENILGQAVPPPPESVPAVEPDIRGATTIREQLAKHRQNESCNECHHVIDPPGFALESFDVIGAYRDHYRSVGEGERVKSQVRGRGVQYRIGPAVDPSAVMPDGRPFADIEQFRARVLEDERQVVRCVAEKLLLYGRGSELSFADRVEIDRIVDRLRDKHYGLRSLIHELVASDAFLKR